MDHHEEYKGHDISVSTRKVGRGYMWSYTVNGDYHEQHGDRPQSEEMALREGLGEAKFRVDRMVDKK